MTLFNLASTPDALRRAYRQERDAWLAHTAPMLENDPRVIAAWLFGSLGRGTEDDLSDVDIFVVLADASADRVMANRQEHIASREKPLLLLDAPQNAPPFGAYNMALYDGQSGPHQVDWYWQPQAQARIPTQTRLLFDRAGLPHSDGPPQFTYQPVPERTPEEAIAQAVNFFWAMLLITAKYAVRKPDDSDTGLLTYPLTSLREVRAFTGDTTPMPFTADVSCPDFGTRLRLLRVLADDMERQMPKLSVRDIPIPDGIAPSMYRYLDFVETVGKR